MHIAKRDCSCRVNFFASGKKAITNCFCASNLLAEMPNILSVFLSFHFWQIILQLTNRHEPTNHSTNLCRGKTWKLFWWHDEVFFWVVDMQDSRSLNKKCKWRNFCLLTTIATTARSPSLNKSTFILIVVENLCFALHRINKKTTHWLCSYKCTCQCLIC